MTRWSTRGGGRALAVAILLAATWGGLGLAPRPARAATPAVVGVDADPGGSSWYPDQGGLSPQVVAGGSFGQQFATQLQGDIQAQPLVVGSTLLVDTEANDAYGLDATSGQVRWSRSLGTPVDSSAIGCNDLPSNGVTGTPVVDVGAGTEYLMSVTYVSGASGPAVYSLHALDITSGAERPGFPVPVVGTAANDPKQTFDATYQLQRPGLVLSGGVVYAAFGGHCDITPTHGWVVGVSTAGHLTTMWSDEAGVDDGTGRGGIWAAGALRSDGPGSLVLTTGNGVDPTTPLADTTPPATLGEAVVHLVVQPDGSLKTTDFFIPFDANHLNTIDGDLGSGSPVLLPSAEFSTPTHPHLAVVVGKEGYLYVLDADHLGGYQQGAGQGDDVLARLGPVQGVWGNPAVWGGDGGYLYFVTNGGSATGAPGATDGKLTAWKFGVDGAGRPTFAQVGASTDAFAYGGTSPVVSSSGTTSGTSVLWVNWVASEGSSYGQLRAYDPVPDAQGDLRLLWSGPSGAAVRLTSPGVGNNKVYLGTTNGIIRGYGSPVQSPLVGGAVGFPDTTVGSSAPVTDTFTATVGLTVTGLSVSGAPFSVGAPSSPLPFTVAKGASFNLGVTFSPTQYGSAGGTLTVTTSAGAYPVGLNGDGLNASPLLTVAPKAISFEGTAVGAQVTADAIFTNQGSQALHVTGVTAPAAPFSTAGVPVAGATVAPGASVAVAVTYAPTAAGQAVDALTLASDGGSITVALSGTSGSPGQLQVTPAAVAFGSVPVGSTVTRAFTVTNAGGSALTVTKSKPPALGAFVATTTLAEGTVLQAGQSVTESVAYRPSTVGAATDQWVLNGSGTSVLTDVALSGTGMAVPALPGPPSAGGWGLAGSAVVSGGDAVLTSATAWQAGSVSSPTAVATDGLTVAFDAVIGGGTGADGMTLTLADASSAKRLGFSAGSLGYSGITGTAVGLVTFKNAGEPSANFVGVADGGPVSPGIPHWVATSTAVPVLEGATTHVVVSVSGHTVTVAVAGVVVLTTVVASLPSLADVVFTGGTGGRTDAHTVRNVTLTYGPPSGA
jgi:hypothetical protein